MFRKSSLEQLPSVLSGYAPAVQFSSVRIANRNQQRWCDLTNNQASDISARVSQSDRSSRDPTESLLLCLSMKLRSAKTKTGSLGWVTKPAT